MVMVIAACRMRLAKRRLEEAVAEARVIVRLGRRLVRTPFSLSIRLAAACLLILTVAGALAEAR